MDGLTLWAVTDELQQLVDGKVEKIQMPEQDTLLLTVRKGGGNYRLLLCAHPENGRVQITSASYTNPAEPPMFCMLLRKRLHGARIKAIVQKNLDGVILVDDREIPAAFLDMAENHKMIVETAGLLTVAALRHLDAQGKKVVAVLSGGNLDVLTMSVLVQHGLLIRDRIFTFSLLLPDRPGELERIAHIIAQKRGNILRMEHNQFVHINRNAAVALEVTLEAFGTEHKQEILDALGAAGYAPAPTATSALYQSK